MRIYNASSTTAQPETLRRVKVLLPLPLAGAYDYRVPAGLDLARGDFVIVPLGTREATGVVWGEAEPGAIAEERLKDVISRLDAPSLSEDSCRFVDWVADYTLAPPGAVMRMAMSVPSALLPPKPRVAYRKADNPGDVRITTARWRVLILLEDGPPMSAAELAREAGVGTSVVRGLVDAGVLETVLLPANQHWDLPDPEREGPELSADQQRAAESLRVKVRQARYSASLLDGVTGSGKTEVYLEAIAENLRAGRQTLVLLPEIALSAEWLERFSDRFGSAPAQWHSELTPAQRRRTWRAVAEGRVPVVVGARSALFLPYTDLGLIVVDEEHDGAFKQGDGVLYHARDMAVVRAHLGEILIVLVSATPSLETVINAQKGRYDHLNLPARHGVAELPDVHVIDLRKEALAPQNWLSATLRNELSRTLEAGEQALLFLNRRGYAPLTLCRACGHRIECPHCTAWLVEHRLAGRLQCHHCGHATAMPDSCPACGAEGRMAACGPGVERLAEEVTALYPEARLATITSDTVHGPAAAADLIRQIRDHELDIVIGTQIIAKGHNFPMLTLVGVVDADLGLTGGDLRAAERTFQLLHQVAGRAGRAALPGIAYLQTYHPDHPVMTALTSGDRDRFLEEEAALREDGAWPPFGRLAALVLSGLDERLVDQIAALFGRSAPRGEGVRVLGPAPAPFAVLRGRHRRRLLMKTSRGVNLQSLLRSWRASVKLPGNVRLEVDVDPYSFL
jgi:primosomal protein N' (replication factor Y)